MEKLELTILIPCFNEEKTIAICIEKAQKFLNENKINGEVLVADNGSTDKSIEIAKEHNARIISVPQRGYGNALISGSKEAKGLYTIMGDADDSYNFLEIMPILNELRHGSELVIGNRYKGKMEKGSMKLSHKYIGTPVLSFLVRTKYQVKVGDINCGLRGYETKKINSLGCKCEGMEYATEMIIKARKANLKITEVAINFYKDKRKGKSHLRTIKDGIRHLKVIM